MKWAVGHRRKLLGLLELKKRSPQCPALHFNTVKEIVALGVQQFDEEDVDEEEEEVDEDEEANKESRQARAQCRIDDKIRRTL